MLSNPSNVLWTEEAADEEQNAVSWTRPAAPAPHSVGETVLDGREEISLPYFKSISDESWYMEAPSAEESGLLFPPLAESPSSAFALDPSAPQAFFPPKPDFSSLLSAVCSNPFDAGLGFVSDSPVNSSGFVSRGVLGFPGEDLMPSPSLDAMVFDSLENSLFLNRARVLRPLEIFPQGGARPTLFQKRAVRRNPSMDLGVLEGSKRERGGGKDAEDVDEASFDGSGLNCDSEDLGTSASVGGNGCDSNSTLTGSGEPKGRKKGLPAKNLMAERRRRKKLNDRLFMLRSVVPKISKMDRASILGDAIEYLKELLQRINGLHDELETINSSLPTSSTTSFHPLTPTPPALPCRIKEELCSSSLPSPNGQGARVEVRLREGQAVNIHMFCARRPGLLLSTMSALDGLGLDIQQAVISCFNGFALDVFRAEQPKNGPGVLPEEIKEVLLQSAGFQNTV